MTTWKSVYSNRTAGQLNQQDALDTIKFTASKSLSDSVCVCVCVCVCSEASTQQEHEEDGAEEDAERAHGGNNNLCHHLHVANQRIWNVSHSLGSINVF